MKEPKFTVCVEGNIGCGKTTMLEYLSQFEDVTVCHEPIEKWTNLNNRNLLDLMYKDSERWSHLFQTYVQLTMLELHTRSCSTRTKLIERSVHSARYCFAENLYRSGRMSEPEFNVFCEWFSFITNNIQCNVDLIVYLQTDPESLHERIRKRNRKEEKLISLSYLKALHTLHEEWLIDGKHTHTPPVLLLNANQSREKMKETYLHHLNQIIYGNHKSETNGNFETTIQ